MRDIENRLAVRRPTTIRAQILFNDGHSSSYCVVRDLSDAGARLATDSGLKFPNAVGLKYLDGPQRLAAPKACEIVWRNGDTLGVHFQAN